MFVAERRIFDGGNVGSRCGMSAAPFRKSSLKYGMSGLFGIAKILNSKAGMPSQEENQRYFGFGHEEAAKPNTLTKTEPAQVTRPKSVPVPLSGSEHKTTAHSLQISKAHLTSAVKYSPTQRDQGRVQIRQSVVPGKRSKSYLLSFHHANRNNTWLFWRPASPNLPEFGCPSSGTNRRYFLLEK